MYETFGLSFLLNAYTRLKEQAILIIYEHPHFQNTNQVLVWVERLKPYKIIFLWLK
jgi:hypothetical protein